MKAAVSILYLQGVVYDQQKPLIQHFLKTLFNFSQPV